jgi:FkbM family methyltransferase
MNAFEKLCITLRHGPLKHAGWLWNMARPIYDGVVGCFAAGGLRRVMNGTDAFLLLPEFRAITEVYEPEVWKVVMAAIGPGSRVVDAGSHIGLYAIPMAQRVGATGKVFAAEPDPTNLIKLRAHAKLNGVESSIEVVPAGLSDTPGEAVLHLQGIQSQLRSADGTTTGTTVRLATVDEVVGETSIDLILVDVEGFELPVLRGAARLLSDIARRPKTIVIEVHPYAWDLCATTSESLLGWLTQHDYVVSDMHGVPVTHIQEYGHVVARQR